MIEAGRPTVSHGSYFSHKPLKCQLSEDGLQRESEETTLILRILERNSLGGSFASTSKFTSLFNHVDKLLATHSTALNFSNPSWYIRQTTLHYLKGHQA